MVKFFVDSSLRKNGYYNDFTIQVNTVLKGPPKNISLIKFASSNTIYNVTSDSNTIQLARNGVAQSVITITPGSYSSTTLAAALIAAQATLVMTVSTTTGLTTLTDSGGQTLTFVADTGTNQKLCNNLGFVPNLANYSGSAIVSTNAFSLLINTMVNVCLNGVSNVYNGMTDQPTTIIQTIYFDQFNFQDVFEYEPVQPLVVDFETSGNMNFSLRDKNGKLIDNHGMEWTATFEADLNTQFN